MRTVAGNQVPLVTPGLVLCQPNQTVQLTAVLAGFEPFQITIDGEAQPSISSVLSVIPERIIGFDVPSQTGVGVGDGWVAVGLRGGKLGFARTDGTSRQIRDLNGLKSVDSDPVISGGRIFFVSNEMTLECVSVDPSVGVRGWPVQLDSEAVTPLAAGDGRLVLVDEGGVMHCWEQATGRRLWGVALGCAPSGAPTIKRRKAYVGASDGRVLVFDVTDGKSIGVLRSPAGITTPVHVVGDKLFFGCDDDSIRAVDFVAGQVLWTENIGRTPLARDLAVSSDSVVVVAAGRVISLDRNTGQEQGELPVEGQVLGVQLQGRRLFVQVRRPRGREQLSREVVFACASGTLSILWEYAQKDSAPGAIGVDANVVALPTASGEVVLFR